jgi:hypothetical protein
MNEIWDIEREKDKVFGKKSEKLLIWQNFSKGKKVCKKTNNPYKRLLKIKSPTAKSTKEHEQLS